MNNYLHSFNDYIIMNYNLFFILYKVYLVSSWTVVILVKKLQKVGNVLVTMATKFLKTVKLAKILMNAKTTIYVPNIVQIWVVHIAVVV